MSGTIATSSEALALHRIDKPGRYQVWSVHTPPALSDALYRLGVAAGDPVDVLHTDFRGTVGLRSESGLVVLGRDVTYHIQVRAQG